MDDICKAILEDALIGYWDLNLVTYNIQFSAAFKTMFGYADEELPHSLSVWQQLIVPEDLGSVLNNFIEHLQSQGKSPIQSEARYRHKNGTIIWVRCTGRVITWDNNKRPVRAFGVATDITHLKHNTVSPSASAATLPAGDKTRVGDWEFNLGTNKLYWSPVIKQIYEVPDDFEPVFDLKARKGTAFTKDEESRDKLNNAIKMALTTGQGYNLELKIVTSTGKEQWARIVGYTDFDQGVCKRMYGTLQDIDSPGALLQDLQISEQQFRSAFENATIGMALVSPLGKLIKVNQVLCDMLGYGPAELMTKDFQDITHPDDLDDDLALVGKVLNNEISSYHLNKRYFHKNGEIVWALLSVSLVRDNAGTPLHFVSQIENITLRRQAEFKLRDSEAKYRKIFENVQDVFYQTDINGILTEISPSIENYSGFKRDDIIGKPVIDFYYYPEDRTGFIENLKTLGSVHDYQIRLKTINDEVLYTSVNAHVLFDDDNNITGFEGSMRDIRERKKAHDALKERDALLTKLSEQIPGVIFQFQFFPDGRSNFPFVSKGMADLFEIDPDELKIDATPVFKRIHRDDIVDVYKSLIASYNNLSKWEHEFRVNMPDKSPIWVQGISKPDQLPDKSVIWYGYVTDVTEKKRKEQQLKSTYELVTEQNNRLLNFAYIISHNLRTHSGNFEILIDLMFDSKDETEKIEMMHLLKRASANLSETIMHLNDVVTIQTSISEHRSQLNLYSYIEKTIAILKVNYAKQKPKIHINVSPDLDIEYNAAYLESILFNFLSNAIKYGKPGRQTVINIDFYTENERGVLQIADNGLGIDLKKNKDKLFGMYKTFHNNKDAKGIGLFITKNQVDAMGGKIEVASEVDKGTTFKIYLS